MGVHQGGRNSTRGSACAQQQCHPAEYLNRPTGPAPPPWWCMQQAGIAKGFTATRWLHCNMQHSPHALGPSSPSHCMWHPKQHRRHHDRSHLPSPLPGDPKATHRRQPPAPQQRCRGGLATPHKALSCVSVDAQGGPVSAAHSQLHPGGMSPQPHVSLRLANQAAPPPSHASAPVTSPQPWAPTSCSTPAGPRLPQAPTAAR